jgi:hypothetical protein
MGGAAAPPFAFSSWSLHAFAASMHTGLAGPPVAKEKIAAAFEEIAGLLEVQQANPFRVRAYRTAAETLRRTPRPAAAILRVEGFGWTRSAAGCRPCLGSVDRRLSRNGSDSTARAPARPGRLHGSPSLGADRGCKVGRAAARQARYRPLEELELAAHDGRLAAVPGLGAKRLAAIRDSLETRLARRRSSPEATTRPTVGQLLAVDREYRERAKQGRLRLIGSDQGSAAGRSARVPTHSTTGAEGRGPGRRA